MRNEKPDNAVARQFGQIDVYLFDQLLRGRILPGMRVLDAGCGGGRNIKYMLGSGFDVSAVDSSPDAVRCVRALAEGLAPGLPAENFRIENIEQLSFADNTFDVVIAIAVLHFAVDDAHFTEMIHRMWAVLKPGGVFFARLASTIGIEDCVTPISGRHGHLPDGSRRYLTDEEQLLHLTKQLGAEKLDPIKTVNVQNMRCMTNWTLRKTP